MSAVDQINDQEGKALTCLELCSFIRFSVTVAEIRSEEKSKGGLSYEVMTGNHYQLKLLKI